MKKNEKKKRKIMLFLLVLLLFLILTIATYAWLSVQRNVEITGLDVKIDVAENLQISLNAEEWLDSIEITDMKQLLGTASGHQARAGDNKNYVPTKLMPVSTTGIPRNGIFEMVKGEQKDKKLENILLCNESNLSQEQNSPISSI